MKALVTNNPHNRCHWIFNNELKWYIYYEFSDFDSGKEDFLDKYLFRRIDLKLLFVYLQVMKDNPLI